METSTLLKPIQSYPGEIVQFIERIPGVDVAGDRETVLERLEPYHKAEVEALGWRWKDLRRAEQVHGTKVALVGDIGSNYPVEGGEFPTACLPFTWRTAPPCGCTTRKTATVP